MKRIFVLLIVSILIISCAPILNAEWSSDPEENMAISTMLGEQALPKIAVDENGYSYVSWFSNEAGNYNMRLQRLDCDGNALWSENGLLVSSEPQDTWLMDYDLTIDPSGYAVIIFSDIRSGQNNPVCYRVSPDGSMMWGPTGIRLADDSNLDANPKVCCTTLGNSIFAWLSAPDTGNWQVQLQKVSPNGDVLWGDGIILSQSGIDFTYPYLQQTEGDYVYLIWHKQTGPTYSPNRGCYVQKLDSDGNFMWESDVEIYAPVPSGAVINLKMCRDDSDGIIFSWYRAYDISHFQSYLQRMDADGNIGMPANGVEASTSTFRNHMYPVPAFLSYTDEIVLFFSEQDLDQIKRGMYAQKFDLQGNRLWGDEGIELIGLSDDDKLLFTADGIDDKAICIYQVGEFGTMFSKMQAVMIDELGNFVWPEEFIDLSTVESEKLHNVMSNYYLGQWVTVWEDRRNGDADIYAQNIQMDGTLGVVVHNPPNKPYKPSGNIKGNIDTMYTYTTSTIDPDVDQVYYLWDWGDGNLSEWLGPFDSGAQASAQKSWNEKGTYNVKVKAKDTFGKESDWSDALSITIPKNRAYSFKFNIFSILEQIFQRFPHTYLILRNLMGY